MIMKKTPTKVLTSCTSTYADLGLSSKSFQESNVFLDIMRQTACLVFNPIMVEGYAALFSCMAEVKASDSMTASM